MMMLVAIEKQKYFSALKDELKQKYRSKREQEKLIKDRKNCEWTYRMSRKRDQFKKNLKLFSKLEKVQGEKGQPTKISLQINEVGNRAEIK